MRSSFTYSLFILATLLLVGCGKCRDLDCENDGFCNEGECICQKWYSGESCDLEYNRNYSGMYYGTYEYSNGIDYRSIDSIDVREGSGPNVLLLESGLELVFLTDSTLEVPAQVLNTSNASYEVSGEGTFSAEHLSFKYERVEDQSQERSVVKFDGQRNTQ